MLARYRASFIILLRNSEEGTTTRGDRSVQNPMFCVANAEERLAADLPLRAIKRQADEVLKALSRDFEAAYSETGRPSIPPEALLKAMLLQALYSIPSERRLVDALNWNLLYRWFSDLDPDAEVWDATTFTKNRERFERHGLCRSSSSGAWPPRWGSATLRTTTSPGVGRLSHRGLP